MNQWHDDIGDVCSVLHEKGIGRGPLFETDGTGEEN